MFVHFLSAQAEQIEARGPVGLGAVVNARFRGSHVIVAETVPYRVERARELGAAHIIDPKAPDAVITGLGSSRRPTLVLRSATSPPIGSTARRTPGQ